jgi:hypothetical protein
VALHGAGEAPAVHFPVPYRKRPTCHAAPINEAQFPAKINLISILNAAFSNLWNQNSCQI